MTEVSMESAEEREAAWREWVASRPDSIRAIAERLRPWLPWRLKSTGQKVWLYSISEPAPPRYPKPTVAVNIYAKDNPDSLFLAMEGGRRVFGIDPDDLEACE